MTQKTLLETIEDFLAQPHVTIGEVAFGRRAVNDGKLVQRLRAGATVTMRTAERINAFISEYRPPVGGFQNQHRQVATQ